ncbi:MAG: heat-shock protein [Variovorax paradoxus]|uniref:Heat-shock protein n=1 Tax=Variovorax paradoxus TaxID=34073 RepID=A0A2W5Q2M1_VARPD|nr:MAG: heat-shock protein [Variovorax paradoxus]
MNEIQTPRATQPAGRQAAQASHDAEDALTPPVDVVEDAQGITLYADLPGVPKDRLRLEVEAGTLTIEGQMQLAVPEALQSSHCEVPTPRFRRVFTLSKELDTEQVSAELAQGVLTLRIPKARHAQARRIDVRVG